MQYRNTHTHNNWETHGLHEYGSIKNRAYVYLTIILVSGQSPCPYWFQWWQTLSKTDHCYFVLRYCNSLACWTEGRTSLVWMAPEVQKSPWAWKQLMPWLVCRPHLPVDIAIRFECILSRHCLDNCGWVQGLLTRTIYLHSLVSMLELGGPPFFCDW